MSENTNIQNSDKKIQLTSEMKKKLSTLESTSMMIRYLDYKKFSRSEISKILTSYLNKHIRYQHVRNVLITPIKKEVKF